MYLSGILSSHLPKIISECKAYKEKVAELFTLKEVHQLSLNHLYKNIIVNPKALFNLIESNFLLQKKTESTSAYFQLKTEILKFIHFLISDFPLNAKLLYEDPFLVVEHNKRINLITYLIRDVREAFKWQIGSSPEEKQVFHKYHQASTAIFYSICQICTLRTSELKLIANSLTDFYYEQQLYTDLIDHCFTLLSTALQSPQTTPFISFIDNSKVEAVRLLMKESEWRFSKGLTMFLWVNPQKCTDFELLRLRSAEGESLIVKIEGSRLSINSSTQQSKHNEQIIEIDVLPDNEQAMIGVELQRSGGIFNSDGYHLNVRINHKTYANISSKIPKFEDCELLAQYSFLNGFIGRLYAVVASSVPQLNHFEQICQISTFGPNSQQLVNELLSKQILDEDEIVCIFNPQRHFQGLLINYVNSGHYASCQGRMLEASHHAYGSKLIDIYLPFLYFISLVKEKNEQSYRLFDSIFRHILSIVTRNNYQTESVLLLLYFLEINQYKITQQTWDVLSSHHASNSNFYLNFVIKYLDIQSLVRSGVSVNEQMQPFSDPVEKLTLMFHIETLWKEKWNELQGFQGWWSPHFFEPQNDRPFNAKDFVYSEKREKRVEWSVLNLVTKDYCKSFIQPVFILPKYAQCDRYQKQYNQKECFSSTFALNLNCKEKYPKLICKKISNSRFDKFKSKIMGNRQSGSPQFGKKKAQQVQIKQFESQCLFIDILTVVEGSISINKEGFVIFHSAHKSKDFDHMCAKAFKNEVFYYFNIPFADVKQIYKKRFNASNSAVYIKSQDGKEMMFHFHHKNVDGFLSILQNFVKVKKDAFSNYVSSDEPIRWIDKFMSNYEYLQWLNEIAGRNYNDITQYPVLPWVFIANGPQIGEQNSAATHRDLVKNIGSHGDSERIKQFLEKYQHNNQQQLFSQYHFGTHYSSSAIIFNFLIRIRPYSIGALALQSGKFDCADRIFHSYCGTWNNATTSTTDIRELIPEIYTLPEMFINKNNYYYGLTQDKVEVDNAILPQWANGNPFYFVAELRKQLETRHVSQNINHWIDLIYGYKQRGKDAVEQMNIFYPLTYEGCIDLDQVTDRAERVSFETQIAHFGQNPSQIIGNNPHPVRRALKAQWEDKLVADGSKLQVQTCFLSRQEQKGEVAVFNSVFEGKNAVLGIKFVNSTCFFVMRQQQYYLFQILNKKTDFISKEQQVELQGTATFNLKQLSSFVPIASISDELVIVGGYCTGYCSIVFLREPKYNRSFQFDTTTITALNYEPAFQTLFVGDVQGYLKIYRVTLFPKHIEFELIRSIKAHDSKVNDITINTNANTVCSCSEDGFANVYNLYSHSIIRTFRHPSNFPIHFVHVTTNPLYAIAFYSKENSTVYVYSINGQFLDSVIEKTGFVYNMSILKATDSTQCLVYLNAQKELFIWELPFLRLKRKVKIRKDQNKISCFEACSNGKIIVTGTDDGSLQIIANPESY